MAPTHLARNVTLARLGAVIPRPRQSVWPWVVLLSACVPEPAGTSAPCNCPVPRCPAQSLPAYAGGPPAQSDPRAGGQLTPPPAAAGVAGDPAVVRAYQGAPALQVFGGQAAYYSDALAGRPTASGEPYDPAAFSAAHRTLPFGTVLRVTGTERPTSVYVRVNDRGPFGDEQRVIDLSRAAAQALGMIRAGVIRVRIEVVAYGRGAR